MTNPQTQNDFLVHRRVRMGLDTLNQEQRHTVEIAIADRNHFLQSTADKRKVRRLSRTEPVYGLNLANGLLLIYRLSENQIEILDLLSQEFLEQFENGENASVPAASSPQVA